MLVPISLNRYSQSERVLLGPSEPGPSESVANMISFGKRIGYWLLALAEPNGLPLPPAAQTLRRGEVGKLCEFAAWHGVLPAVVSNLRKVRALHGPQRIIAGGNAGPAQSELDEALKWAHRRVVHMTWVSLMLRAQLGPIGAALAKRGIPAIVLKGTDFADRLYPEASFRPFGDIDILVRPKVVAEAEDVMANLGYKQSRNPRMKHTFGYGQRSWRLEDGAGGDVEIHWDLVNSPSLRRSLSVKYEDLQIEQSGGDDGGLGRPSASSVLLIAAVHGAASHTFDRLRLVCDVWQSLSGAAGKIDEEWLRWASRRTGSGLAVATALMLAEKAFGQAESGRLAGLLGRGPAVWLSQMLLTPDVVLRSQSPLGASRRSLFRELLKRGRSPLS